MGLLFSSEAVQDPKADAVWKIVYQAAKLLFQTPGALLTVYTSPGYYYGLEHDDEGKQMVRFWLPTKEDAVIFSWAGANVDGANMLLKGRHSKMMIAAIAMLKHAVYGRVHLVTLTASPSIAADVMSVVLYKSDQVIEEKDEHEATIENGLLTWVQHKLDMQERKHEQPPTTPVYILDPWSIVSSAVDLLLLLPGYVLSVYTLDNNIYQAKRVGDVVLFFDEENPENNATITSNDDPNLELELAAKVLTKLKRSTYGQITIIDFGKPGADTILLYRCIDAADAERTGYDFRTCHHRQYAASKTIQNKYRSRAMAQAARQARKWQLEYELSPDAHGGKGGIFYRQGLVRYLELHKPEEDDGKDDDAEDPESLLFP